MDVFLVLVVGGLSLQGKVHRKGACTFPCNDNPPILVCISESLQWRVHLMVDLTTTNTRWQRLFLPVRRPCSSCNYQNYNNALPTKAGQSRRTFTFTISLGSIFGLTFKVAINKSIQLSRDNIIVKMNTHYNNREMGNKSH